MFQQTYPVPKEPFPQRETHRRIQRRRFAASKGKHQTEPEKPKILIRPFQKFAGSGSKVL